MNVTDRFSGYFHLDVISFLCLNDNISQYFYPYQERWRESAR